jgi:phage head maturation protease
LGIRELVQGEIEIGSFPNPANTVNALQERGQMAQISLGFRLIPQNGLLEWMIEHRA